MQKFVNEELNKNQEGEKAHQAGTRLVARVEIPSERKFVHLFLGLPRRNSL
jgi:hypothetical protein